jgi:D-serine deaminase-like pyridoxal phosphate-dependent protein
MRIDDLATPALVVDLDALDRNVAVMADRFPGMSLRPHVKAHKCTALAARQVAAGHRTFTCATPREVIGMANAGVGEHLLLANEVLDHERLAAMVAACDRAGIGLAIAIDSVETLEAAQRAGVCEVLIDVEVGLPRCGVAPEIAGSLADKARDAGIEVSGVMGYEGHLQMVHDRADQRVRVAESMTMLRRAHDDVGGHIVSAGGTGTHLAHVIGLDHPTGVTEIQAGSYALMDTQYDELNDGFERALTIFGTVISVNGRRGVADVGLKALGMDHGNPSIDGATVWFCSDEHLTFATPEETSPSVGSRVRVTPAHVDPTIARHETIWVTQGDEVVDRWPIDLRHW